MKINNLILLALATAAPTFNAHLRAAASLDPDLVPYQKVSGIAGNINVIGSDTLLNMMSFWSEGFQAIYPNVKIQIEGKGSSTAPPALIQGTAQIGPMSRPMKDSEIDQFVAKFGYAPTKVIVALDAVAVFVHKDNPLEGCTMAELDAVFSNTFKLGHSPVTSWGDLGLDGDFQNREISVYGRNSASGTYGFFKDIALAGGDYKPTVKEQPGSSAVVQGIASDLYGIGYSGVGYKTSGVKTLALTSTDDESLFFHPTFENAMSGDYPLARFLLMYVNKAPNQSLDNLTLEFIRFIHSREGQAIVMKDGYYPLPAAVCQDVIESVSR